MSRTDYTAKGILAKGRQVSVYYGIHRKNPHRHGPCACGKTAAFTIDIVIQKVKADGKELSSHDLLARAAAGKVMNHLQNGRRMCDQHFQELLEVAKQKDHLGQIFAS